MLVTLEKDTDFELVRSQLEAKGLTEATLIPGLPIVHGSAPPDRMDALRAVLGVKHVQLEGSVQLAPPKSPIQ
jgi:hypothetical protein